MDSISEKGGWYAARNEKEERETEKDQHAEKEEKERDQGPSRPFLFSAEKTGR